MTWLSFLIIPDIVDSLESPKVTNFQILFWNFNLYLILQSISELFTLFVDTFISLK